MTRSARQSGAPPKVPVASRSLTLTIKAGGRVVLPAELRAELGVQEGDVLHARFSDGELVITSRDSAIRRAQELVRRYVPAGVSLVDQLIDERRAEAGRESQ